MKKIVSEFLRRGLTACGFGPLVLAVLYLILKHNAGLEILTVDQVCIGIVSLFVLAFVAGGMNAVYQIERLPLAVAILIHGGVLYISYLGAYLVNGWLDWGMTPVLAFTGIFALGYLMIWAFIYTITKRNTDRVNAALLEKQQGEKHCP